MGEPIKLMPWEVGDLAGEHWVPAVGYEGFYEVSNLGRVRSVDRVIHMDGPIPRRPHPGRVLKQHVPESRYPEVNLLGRTTPVHHVVGATFAGPKPPGTIWRHMDDDRMNLRATNIVWGTWAQNADDARCNGKTALGEANARALLSEREVSAVKALDGLLPRTWIARRFRVATPTIRDIHAARTWRHVSAISQEEALAIFHGKSTVILPHIEFTITWDLVETQIASFGRAARIYYSNDSTFWSHHRGHALANGPEMKCPLGTQIFAEEDWEGWLAAARENEAHYGKHGLRTLLAGHHSNVRDATSGGFFAARGWRVFNDALDALDAEQAKLREKPKRIDLTAPKRTAFANPRTARRG